MTCPKCEEGTLNQILFKQQQEYAFLCDFCGSVWLEGESIKLTNGTTIQALTNSGDWEYSFVDRIKEDDRLVRYPKYK